MKKSMTAAFAALFVATGGAWASGDHGGGSKTATNAAPASAEMTDGEVRKVDMDTKKITLKHGEIKNLQMPGMTMVFQVKEPAMLDQVKNGDKVRFSAEKVGGAFVVTNIEAAK